MDQRIAEVLRIINTELAGDLSITSLARRIYISPSHLSHLFKLRTGTSLVSHVRRQRIEKATHLLINSTLSIKEIAATLHFSDSHHFSWLFAKQVGYPPSQTPTKAGNGT